MLAGLFSPVPYEYKNSYYASDIAINKIMKNDKKMLKIKQKRAKLKHGKIMDLLDAMNEIQYRHIVTSQNT